METKAHDGVMKRRTTLVCVPGHKTGGDKRFDCPSRSDIGPWAADVPPVHADMLQTHAVIKPELFLCTIKNKMQPFQA
jgi:hypothetical protein